MWESAVLDKVCNIYSGNSINAKKKADLYTGVNGVPYIATKDISFDGIIDYDNGVAIPQEDSVSFKAAPENTVFVCAEGGSAGRKIAISDRQVCFVNKLFALVHFDRLLPKFVYYYTLSESFQSQFKDALTGLIGGVSLSKIKKFTINFPSIEEQKRIVAILDEAFAGIDKAIANTEQNIQNIYEIFESYLDTTFIQDGCAGNLRKLGDVIDVLTDYHANGSYKILKQHVELKDQEDFAWMVRSTDFENNFENSKRYIDEHAYNFLTKSQLLGGEIIMSKIGNAGKVYFMPEIDRPCSLAMNLFLIRLNNSVADNEYVFRYLNSRAGKNQIQPLLNGAATQTITKDSVKSLVVPLSSVDSQRKTVQRLRLLEAEKSRLIDIYKTKVNALNELKQSLLQKAFAGELTSDLSEAA